MKKKQLIEITKPFSDHPVLKSLLELHRLVSLSDDTEIPETVEKEIITFIQQLNSISTATAIDSVPYFSLAPADLFLHKLRYFSLLSIYQLRIVFPKIKELTTVSDIPVWFIDFIGPKLLKLQERGYPPEILDAIDRILQNDKYKSTYARTISRKEKTVAEWKLLQEADLISLTCYKALVKMGFDRFDLDRFEMRHILSTFNGTVALIAGLVTLEDKEYKSWDTPLFTILQDDTALEALRIGYFTFNQSKLLPNIFWKKPEGIEILRDKLLSLDSILSYARQFSATKSDTYLSTLLNPLLTSNGILALREKLINLDQVIELEQFKNLSPSILTALLSDNGLIALRSSKITINEIIRVLKERNISYDNLYSILYRLLIFNNNGIALMQDGSISLHKIITIFKSDAHIYLQLPLFSDNAVIAFKKGLVSLEKIKQFKTANINVVSTFIDLLTLLFTNEGLAALRQNPTLIVQTANIIGGSDLPCFTSFEELERFLENQNSNPKIVEDSNKNTYNKNIDRSPRFLSNPSMKKESNQNNNDKNNNDKLDPSSNNQQSRIQPG